MAKKDDIAAKLANQNIKVDFGGTIGRPTGDETYATGIANELIGGHHSYATIDDLAANMSFEVMLKGMNVTIDEHEDGGVLIPKRQYYLQTVPPLADGQTLDDIPGYDFSAYFKLIPEPAKFEGTEEVQYAPDVNGAQPAFKIGATWYQNGETSSTDNTVIWVADHDPAIHRWFRKRAGVNSNWSIPTKIGSAFEEGQYIDNIYQWVLKTDPDPATPGLEVGGKLNNEPAGWDDTPSNYPVTDYATSILTYNIWKTSGVKDVFGDLKGPWDKPLKTSQDPNLVQYGVPSSGNSNPTDNPSEWHDEFLVNDTHQATRQDLGGGNYTAWAIQKITNESGRFKDFVFKAFPLGTPPVVGDIPTDKEPFGKPAPNDANDTPPSAGENEIVYVSQAEKFNNGELINPPGWSFWRRWDGQDTIQVVIRYVEGSYFRKGVDNVVSPTQITLIADLFRGKDLIASGMTFKWYKTSAIPANEMPSITNTQVINPADVTDFDVFIAEITFEGQTYTDQITLLDLTDGRALVAWIEANDGFTFKNQTGSKTFTPKFFKNGLADIADVTFVWKVDGVVQTEVGSGSGSENVNATTKVITIQGADVSTQAILSLEATFAATTYEVKEVLTDVDDGEDVIIEYSFDALSTAPASVANWQSNGVGANWMRHSTDGGATYTGAIQIKGEAGVANAGRDLTIWQVAASAPSVPANKVSGSIIPAGWSIIPPAIPGGQNLYGTNAKFTLVPGGDVAVDTVTNWTQQTSWSSVWQASTEAVQGVPGGQGDPGDRGWSPILAVVNDGSRRVHQVIDWTGGEGAKPSSPWYLSDSGFTTSISAAKDIRGSAGSDGQDAGNSTYYSSNYNGGTIKKVIDGNWTASEVMSPSEQLVTSHIATGLTAGKRYYAMCTINVLINGGGNSSHGRANFDHQFKVFGQTRFHNLPFDMLDRQNHSMDSLGITTFRLTLFGFFIATSSSASFQARSILSSVGLDADQVRVARACIEVTD